MVGHEGDDDARGAKKTIDYLYEQIVGPAGKAQWLAFLAYGPITIASIIPLVNHGVGVFEPRHRYTHGNNWLGH